MEQLQMMEAPGEKQSQLWDPEATLTRHGAHIRLCPCHVYSSDWACLLLSTNENLVFITWFFCLMCLWWHFLSFLLGHCSFSHFSFTLWPFLFCVLWGFSSSQSDQDAIALDLLAELWMLPDVPWVFLVLSSHVDFNIFFTNLSSFVSHLVNANTLRSQFLYFNFQFLPHHTPLSSLIPWVQMTRARLVT